MRRAKWPVPSMRAAQGVPSHNESRVASISPSFAIAKLLPMTSVHSDESICEKRPLPLRPLMFRAGGQPGLRES
jgi:hypothetical protein